MKKSLLIIIMNLILIVTGCSNGSAINTTNSSKINQNSTDRGNQQEGGDSALVYCKYVFDDTNSFLDFYNEFKKKNGERFIFPIDDASEINIKYTFTSEGVEVRDYLNSNYEIRYPFANLKIEFLIEDKDTIFTNRQFYAEYNSNDMSQVGIQDNLNVSYSLENQEILICTDEKVLTKFKFTYTNYKEDDVRIFLEKIKRAIERGREYAL